MTAVEIAEVIGQISEGRVQTPLELRDQAELFAAALKDATVVDSTKIYQELLEVKDPIHLYEDHGCLTPAFGHAAFCYVNEHGNVIVMQAMRFPIIDWTARWESEDGIDWDQVKWVVACVLWAGGRSKTLGRTLDPVGPCMRWEIVIDADGKPLDMHWTHLIEDYPMEHWDMAHLVLIRSMSFLACTNVDMVEAKYPRAERRRIQRAAPSLDLRMHTIQVFPNNKRYVGRGKNKVPVEGQEVGGFAAHRVRGHFATYGTEGRGLLFGKYAGRFYIPDHSRGKKELGEIKQDYQLVPEEA